MGCGGLRGDAESCPSLSLIQSTTLPFLLRWSSQRRTQNPHIWNTSQHLRTSEQTSKCWGLLSACEVEHCGKEKKSYSIFQRALVDPHGRHNGPRDLVLHLRAGGLPRPAEGEEEINLRCSHSYYYTLTYVRAHYCYKKIQTKVSVFLSLISNFILSPVLASPLNYYAMLHKIPSHIFLTQSHISTTRITSSFLFHMRLEKINVKQFLHIGQLT